jgi:tmRNA-binding protein
MPLPLMDTGSTIKALRSALSELLDAIDSLEGIALTSDIEPYKAEAIWDDTTKRARKALKDSK